MRADCPRTIKFLQNEIVQLDSYRLRKLAPPDVVVDIGGNIGVFALFARELWPETRIVSIEPYPETYGFLAENTAGKNIDLYNVALGDGKPVRFSTYRDSLSLQTVPSADGIPSFPFRELLAHVGVTLTDRSVLKVDCEGAETALLGLEAVALMQQVQHLCIEYHVKGRKGEFPIAMTWAEWGKWVKDLSAGPLHVETKGETVERGYIWGTRA